MLRNAVASRHCFIIFLGGAEGGIFSWPCQVVERFIYFFYGPIFAFWKRCKHIFFFCHPGTPTLSPCLFCFANCCGVFVGVASPLSAVLRRPGSIKPLWKFCLKPEGASFALCVCGENAKGPWHIFWYLCFWESKRRGGYDVKFRRKQNIGILMRSVALSHRENFLLFYNSDSRALFSEWCDLFWTHFCLGFKYPCNGFPSTLRF